MGEKKNDSVRLLPVRVSESTTTPVLEPEGALSPTSSVVSSPAVGNIYIKFPKIHLRVESGADAALLRVVLETSAAMMGLRAEDAHLDRGRRDRLAARLRRD